MNSLEGHGVRDCGRQVLAGGCVRIALLADVHANLVPLEAVVGDIRRRGAQLAVCLGDALDVGCQPQAVLENLIDLGCVFTMGNHDQGVLDPAKATELNIPPHLLPVLEWTAASLSPLEEEMVRRFPPTVELDLGDGLTFCGFHGSPQRLCDLVLPTTPEEALDHMFVGVGAHLLAGGHTHQQMYRRWATRILVNRGSVGCAWVWDGKTGGPTLMPWAEYALVETGRAGTEVELIRVPFDTERARNLAEASDNPAKSWWEDQYGAIGQGTQRI